VGVCHISDNAIRNGTKAVALQRALEISGEQDPRIFRLLAAAYAENGQFEKAADTAQRGAQLATTQGNYALANVIQSNMDLYRRSLPLRDSRD
jgi:Flp pilus assembly protein TadD